ncbi:hypothetical protein K435DRAFT_967495 [Dendrothele bispora CBS 962.96]|uniref:Uncharacterized protein n=1 Tax=Dendrothele bispora (strain CBS 962.96) TaxID=1314807 RepID=A0A4V4HF02_DENBC|nr:hypothetical protein K435DRAFT_967495 [Dendrothele bispora CBS 962.96]
MSSAESTTVSTRKRRDTASNVHKPCARQRYQHRLSVFGDVEVQLRGMHSLPSTKEEDTLMGVEVPIITFFSLLSLLPRQGRQREGQTQQRVIRKELLTRFWSAYHLRLPSLFLHDVLPSPTLILASPSPNPSLAYSTLRPLLPIATDRSADADYTMQVEERVINIPSATTLPPDFEGSPSVAINPYTSTVTGTLMSNGDSWLFETSDDSPVYFYEDCELTNSNAIIQLSPSSSDKLGILM